MVRKHPAPHIRTALLIFSPIPECCLRGIALNDLRNLSNTLVFLWFQDKSGHWFHVHVVQNGVIYGYALQDKQWVYRRFPVSRIAAYY